MRTELLGCCIRLPFPFPTPRNGVQSGRLAQSRLSRSAPPSLAARRLSPPPRATRATSPARRAAPHRPGVRGPEVRHSPLPGTPRSRPRHPVSPSHTASGGGSKRRHLPSCTAAGPGLCPLSLRSRVPVHVSTVAVVLRLWFSEDGARRTRV